MKKSRQSQPVSVLDLASYILANHTRNAPIPAWKMHKLAYYCQAWSLVNEGTPFFNEKILATSKGVIIQELCPQHFNHLYVGGSTIGNLNHLSLKQVDTIDDVMKKYGMKSVEELDQMISSETPFLKAMKNFSSKKPQPVEVDLKKIMCYFSSQK